MENINWKENLELAQDIIKGTKIPCGVILRKNEDDEQELVLDCGIIIRNEIREFKKETISGTLKKKTPTYVVEVIKVISYYPNSPDEEEAKEIGNWNRIEDAIANALIALMTDVIKNATENAYMDKYFHDMEEIYGKA